MLSVAAYVNPSPNVLIRPLWDPTALKVPSGPNYWSDPHRLTMDFVLAIILVRGGDNLTLDNYDQEKRGDFTKKVFSTFQRG